MTTTSIRRSPLGLDWRWAPGASRALRMATNQDNFELPTYSAPERRDGAKTLPTYFWLPPVQSYVGREKKTKRGEGSRVGVFPASQIDFAQLLCPPVRWRRVTLYDALGYISSKQVVISEDYSTQLN